LSTLGSPATVLVASTADIASMNLARALVETYGFKPTGVQLLGKQVFQKDSYLLATFDSIIIDPPDLDSYFNPRAYIFLSRHSASSGIPSLTAHTTGNFSTESRFGGRGMELGRVDPDLLKNYIISLTKRGAEAEGYKVTIEATHHGPTSLSRPVMFVEIGSSERNWEDSKAANVVAGALVESLQKGKTWDKVAVAFGGTHYPEKFNKLLLETDFALAHIVPKYSLEHVNSDILGQMLSKTSRPVRYAVLDWKGLGTHKEKILGLASTFGLELIKL
jgi:D-aminoacyl-tRNA deacylase